MNRQDFVLAYKNEENKIICAVCANIRESSLFHLGYSCVPQTRVCFCIPSSGDSDLIIKNRGWPKFDNTKHKIYADMNGCHGKKYGCTKECFACKVTISNNIRRESHE